MAKKSNKPRWRGRVRPLTKKFLQTFSEEEIIYLEKRMSSDCRCGDCILTSTVSRFAFTCSTLSPSSGCQEIFGIYPANNGQDCGCHVLGQHDAIAYIKRICRKWRELNALS